MRVTPLARRLGAAALVLTIGVGPHRLQRRLGRRPTPRARPPTTAPTRPPTTATDEATDEESEAEASLAELSADDFYPAVMAAMREAETFNFETVSDSAGQSQTMSGQARFSDAGMEMKASSTGAQAMELILLGKAMYMKSPAARHRRQVAQDRPERPRLAVRHDRQGDRPRGHVQGDGVAQEARADRHRGRRRGERPTTTGSPWTRRSTSRRWSSRAAMADMLPKELVTEMWVDGDNLPRKFAQTIEVPARRRRQPTTLDDRGHLLRLRHRRRDRGPAGQTRSPRTSPAT